MVKIICAWCGKILCDGDEEIISHGICQECEEKLKENMHHVPID